MKKILKYLRKYRIQSVLGLFFKLTEAVFELIVPLVMIRIIDTGIKNSDKNYVINMGIILVILGAVGFIVSITAQYFAAKAAFGFGGELRKYLFSHIQSFSQAEIEKFGSTSLIVRLTNDVNQLQVGVNMTIRLFLRAPFIVVGAIIMAFSIDVKLSLIFLAAAFAVSIILFIITKTSVPYFKNIQKKLDRISTVILEYLLGVRVIRAFSKQSAVSKNFNDINSDYRDTSYHVGKISALINPLTYIVLNLGVIAILWVGGNNVDSGRLTQGQIVALVNYMTQILLALIVVSQLVIIYMKSLASKARVVEVLDCETSINDDKKVVPEIKDNNCIIRFNDVNFSYYNNGENALEKINIIINKGETVGIIGPTGSGKTTLVNLMLRLYNVTDGEILINGVNINKYPLSYIRNKMVMVAQKPVLFEGTIRDNIKWGKVDATDDQIYKALDIAQAKEFVDSYILALDTKVLQNGKNFSKGQRQRLSIARAVIAKPEVLILDDSSSALDFATDAKLRYSLSKLNADMTTIVISLRASTLKNADKIIVLDDGIVKGIGSHDYLISCCEVYREICNSQRAI